MTTAVTITGLDALADEADITTTNTTPAFGTGNVVKGTGSTIKADASSSVRGTGNGLRINWDTNGGAGELRMPLPAPGTAQVASNIFKRRFYYKTASTQGADVTFMQLNASLRAFTLLRRVTNGAFRILDSANTALDSDGGVTGVATDNTWYRVEIYADNTNGAGASTLIVRIYTLAGVKVYEKNITTATISTGVFIQLRIGASGYNPTAGSHAFDVDTFADGGPSTEFGVFSAPVTSARPIAVTQNGTWVNNGGAASVAAALADELASTYGTSPDNPSSPFYLDAQVTDASHPLASGDVTVNVDTWVDSLAPGMDVLVELRSPAATVISSRHVTPTGSVVRTSWTPSAGEQTALAATDKTDVHVRISPAVTS